MNLERIRQREQLERLAAKRRLAMKGESEDAAPKPEVPSGEDPPSPDGTKETLLIAGALVGMAGKWTGDKAKSAAAAAADKAKQAKERLSAMAATRRPTGSETPPEELPVVVAAPNESTCKDASSDGGVPAQVREGVAPERRESVSSSTPSSSPEPDCASSQERVQARPDTDEPTSNIEPVRSPAMPPKAPLVGQEPVVITRGRSDRVGLRRWLVIGVLTGVFVVAGGAVWWVSYEPGPEPQVGPVPTARQAPVQVPTPVVAREPTVPEQSNSTQIPLEPQKSSAEPAEVVESPGPTITHEEKQIDTVARSTAPAHVSKPRTTAEKKASNKQKPTVELDWQDKAQQDMDAWAEQLGI